MVVAVGTVVMTVTVVVGVGTVMSGRVIVVVEPPWVTVVTDWARTRPARSRADAATEENMASSNKGVYGGRRCG